MTTPWRKALRDLQEESARTLLVVLAIALGIAGFAAVLASYAILTRELNRGYLATNPASATLRTDAVDDALLAAVAATPGVRQAEARRTVSGRIKGGTRGWRNLVLFAAPDFRDARVGTITPERGAWPPQTGQILIERDAFQVARVKIGDSVVVGTPGGVERTLRVAGMVHDVGQAQARMENIVYGYVSTGTLEQLGEGARLNQLKLVIDGDERRVRAVAAQAAKVAEAKGHPVGRVEVPVPGKHPHADIMGLLMLVLAAFGLFVVLLSGVIVMNLLTAVMAAQVRQIGVMKALGATRAQVARIYFGQALLLGATAVALALPAAVWGSRALCRAMAVFLNFDVTSFAIPLWVYAAVVAVGIVVPLLAVAVPVWRSSGISVRRALADFGVAAQGFGTTRFDRLVAGLGGAARPLLLAVRNSFRRRTRLALTMLTLAAGGLFFMTALNFRASMIETLDRLFAMRRFDLALAVAGTAPAAEVERIVRATPGVRDAECWMVSGDHVTVFAVPPQTRMLAPRMASGRWLRAADEVVINSALASRIGTPRTLPLGGKILHVVGVMREPFSPAVAYAPLDGNETNSVRIVLDRTDPDSIERVKGDLETNLGRAGIKVTALSSKSDSRFAFDQHMVMIYVALIIMSALIGGVGGLGLMTTMSLNVLERRREMGVLRALGATPRVVWLMILAEGSVAAIVAWALAAAAAWPLGKALGALVAKIFRIGLDDRFELLGLFLWLAVSLLLGALASFIPARHAARHSVREALNYE